MHFSEVKTPWLIDSWVVGTLSEKEGEEAFIRVVHLCTLFTPEGTY